MINSFLQLWNTWNMVIWNVDCAVYTITDMTRYSSLQNFVVNYVIEISLDLTPIRYKPLVTSCFVKLFASPMMSKILSIIKMKESSLVSVMLNAYQPIAPFNFLHSFTENNCALYHDLLLLKVVI